MKAALFCLSIVLTAAAAAAQPLVPPCNQNPRTYQDLWCAKIEEIVAARAAQGGTAAPSVGLVRSIEAAIDYDRNWRPFLLYAQARSQAVDQRPVEDARIDKQVGAPASAAGSTSIVSKGAVPSVLGFAVENGALTQSASATAVTLRGNLVGWLDLIQNQGFIESYQDDSRAVRQLRRVSYSLTLNTNAGTAPTAPAPSGAAAITPAAIRAQLKQTQQQLAGYSVRVALWDQRDPRTTANRASIATMLDVSMVKQLQANEAFVPVLNSDEYQTWYKETVDTLADPTLNLAPTDIQRIFYQRFEALRLHLLDRIEGFDEQVAKNLLAMDAFNKARVRLFQAMQRQPLVAFEYVNAPTRDLPDTSTLRLIAEGQWGPRLDLTANIAMTLQHRGVVPLPEPRSVGGTRDFQAAAQFEVPLGSLEKRVAAGTGIGSPVLGLAYLSQKLTERAAVSFAGNTFTIDPGWIHVIQAKVTVPVKGSGVKIPLSVSYANRTELLKEKDIRGHIGLTFDMDVLSSLIRR